MKRWQWPSLAVLFSVVLDGLISYANRTLEGLDFNPLRLAALLLLFSTSFYFHSRNTAVQDKPGRKIQIWCYDYLRILAVILVISVHTFDMAATSAKPGSFAAYVLLCGSALGLCCNQIYVMISGALILGKEKINLFSFYWSRFLKAGIPLICYYFIYKAVHGGLINLYPENLPRLFLQIIQGPFDGAPHFWLIYVILSLYIIAPFLSIMLRFMPENMLKALIILILLSQAGASYLPYFGILSGIHFVLSSWEGIFIIGYFLTRTDSLSWRRLFLAAGAISAVITIWGTITIPNTSLFVNTAPTMTFMAGAVFAGFLSQKDRLKPLGVILSAVSKYSYSIILIHWYVLYYMVGERFLVLFEGISILIGCGITIAAVLMVSFVTAWVFDYVVVFLVQSVLSYLPRLVKGLK